VVRAATWGAAAVRHVVSAWLRVCSCPAPESEGENVSAQQCGDACFFSLSADRRAREMTRCGAAETKQRQAYPLPYALSRSSGGLERSLLQHDRPSGGFR